MIRAGLALVLFAGLRPGHLRAQSLDLTAAHWFTTPNGTDVRVGMGGLHVGPLRLAPFGQAVFAGTRTDRHLVVGAGADLLVRVTPSARPYLVGGVSGGFLDLKGGGPTALWHGWSAGAGFEVGRVVGIGVGVEARYQSVSRPATSGVTIGLRLGPPIGRRSPTRRATASQPTAPAPDRRREPPSPTPASPSPSLSTTGRGSRAEVRSALKAALDVMGTPYRWGGTTDNGFDCSGLIQYAYATAGVALPRRSQDQARAGRSVGTAQDELEPGDILAFSGGRNGVVTHVGLYLGNGRFIHSARDGVVVSSLSSDDITGRWWLDRWVDSRRLID